MNDDAEPDEAAVLIDRIKANVAVLAAENDLLARIVQMEEHIIMLRLVCGLRD